ncbi:MAG TPA: alpha/beta fold hydrolase, partial [Pyrinomonadaceae bacterium]|nr:alpha/beta fold hydrolase [Pyrinomonadaceae bacterium]
MSLINVGDIQLAYTDTGVGLPVVLLHGYPFNRSMWNEQVSALSNSFRVITPDLRGLGESEATSGPVTMDRMAQDVAMLLDHLEIPRAVIGGLSMGGYVALAFYKLFPSRVRALILADTRAQADTPEGIEGRQRMIQLVREKGPAAAADEMLPRLIGDSTRASRPEVEQAIRTLILSNSTETIAGALMALMTRPDATPLLPTIHCPALVLVGDEDVITPP